MCTRSDNCYSDAKKKKKKSHDYSICDSTSAELNDVVKSGLPVVTMIPRVNSHFYPIRTLITQTLIESHISLNTHKCGNFNIHYLRTASEHTLDTSHK